MIYSQQTWFTALWRLSPIEQTPHSNQDICFYPVTQAVKSHHTIHFIRNSKTKTAPNNSKNNFNNPFIQTINFSATQHARPTSSLPASLYFACSFFFLLQKRKWKFLFFSLWIFNPFMYSEIIFFLLCSLEEANTFLTLFTF